MNSSFHSRAWYRATFAVFGLVAMIVIRRDFLVAAEISSWAEISAWGLLILGLWWSRDVEDRFVAMVRRLEQRQVIAMTAEEADSLLASIEGRARMHARLGMVLFPIAILLAYGFIYYFRERTGDLFLFKLVLEVTAAAMVGGIGGRMVAYGCLGNWLRLRNLSIGMKLGHPDGAAGLKVVGNFFLYQATLVLLPAIFFGFWWAIAPSWPVEGPDGYFNFLEWRNLFVLFFVMLMGIEILAFVVPMVYFHREMSAHRRRYDQEADEIGEAILRHEAEMAGAGDRATVERGEVRKGLLQKRYELLDAAPCWPVDSRILRRFTWGNVALFALPMLTKLPHMPQFIGETLDNLMQMP